MAVNTQTYTATLQNVPMQGNHSGINFARGRFGPTNVSNTDSSYCRVYLCKLPHGATIVDWWGTVSGGASTNAAATGALGIWNNSTADATMTVTLRAADASLTTTHVIARGDDDLASGNLTDKSGYMYRISVSSSQADQFKWLGFAYTVLASVSSDARALFVDVTVMYTMDYNVCTDGLTTVT